MNDNAIISSKCEQAFGVRLRVTDIIARAIPTGFASTATVFTTSPTMLYVLIVAEGAQLLADAQKIIRGMNMDADEFLPPHADADYFQRIGEEKFKAMFPGKHLMGDDDTRYYRTLAPYNPALVRIARVKGEIRGFQAESKSWRKVREYAFSRIALD